ncbi:MAG: hypothetical protein BGO69_02885 [Bacteroidetes bacterium 46-16]|nr:MAG: hypothetical protein BGO69_02885 [Bacteroidetes bacterium 46-16]
MKTFMIAPVSGITDLALVFIPGFIIHSLAPLRYRPFIYNVIFVICLFYVFSWVTAVAIGVFLAFTAWVIFRDMKLRLKYIYLVLLAIVFMLLRNSFLFYMPRVNMSIPFAAAILMFRIVVLMYEVKYSKMPENYWLKLSYFFCFPNLAFLYFPIIDYKTYARSYYASPFNAICNKALLYMMTGISFLLVYKYSTYYLDVSYADVHDVYSLFWLLLSKYTMVIKATGLLILGLSFVYMFGFDMPPLFGNFFLATSFNNYWQRVNIYWKDFIVKVVYYPLYFRYRKRLKNVTTVCIILAVLSSWIFHVYQKFWLSGSISMQVQDFLYWFILAVLVALDLYILGKNTKKGKEAESLRTHIIKSGGFVIVFITMLVLWLLWNSGSISTFTFIMSEGLHATVAQLMLVVTLIIAAMACFTVYLQLSSRYKTTLITRSKRYNRFAYTTLFALCLLGIARPYLSKSKLVTVAFSKENVKKDDKAQKEAGYYAAVTDTKTEDWEVGLSWGDRRSLFGHIGKYSNDLVFQLLKPNASINFMGHKVTTNSYGFRDKDYPLQKGANTFRIALVGGSYEMGSGVDENEVFEKIVEDSLNTYYKGDPNIEILNFAMGSFTSVPQMEILRTQVIQFHPDEMMIFYHTDEMRRASRFFARYITNGVDLKYDYLLKVKAASGVKQSMSIEEIISRLDPYMPALTAWCYSQMDSICRANNIKPVWIFLPTTSDELEGSELVKFRHMADTAGFSTYVLNGVFDGYKHDQIVVSDEDTHPNALGHRLIANKLFNLLTDSTNHIIFKK